MRRTTISRSRCAILLAAVPVFGMAAGASAQDTLQMDTTAAGTTPEVHVVARGETLWDLAQRYYGDPFLWPEIYRLNTIVVEDPHWIYPGEELRLVAPSPELVAAMPDSVPMEEEQVPMEEEEEDLDAQLVQRPAEPAPERPQVLESTLFRPASVQRQGITFAGMNDETYRAVRRSEFYASGFLTENERLPFARVVGAVGESAERGRRSATASSAVINEQIEVVAPEGSVYQVGDSLLIATLQREISGWGRVVLPTGLVRLEDVSGRRAIGRIITQFNVILGGQVALPAEQFRDPGPVRPVPIENGVVGSVISAKNRDPVPNQQDVLFIDLGRSDGVVPGDVFEIVRHVRASSDYASAPEESLGLLRIVHVRENSATGLIGQIYESGIRPGSTVRLIRKMPT